MVSILLKNKVLWRGGIPSESETANYMGKTNTNKRAMTNDKVSIIFTFDKNSIWLQMNFIKHHHFIFFVIFMYFFVTIPAKTSETYHQPRFRMMRRIREWNLTISTCSPQSCLEVSCVWMSVQYSTVQYSAVQYSGGISTDNTQDGRRSTPGPASAAAAGLR